MSINDVANYVRQTPGNTNPSVIKSMVQSEVNGTLKESKAYTDEKVNNLLKNGGAGSTERKVVLAKQTFELSDYRQKFMANKQSLKLIGLVPGETYTVDWNGMSYTCTCSGFEYDGSPVYYLGNGAIIGSAESEEPFFIADFLSDDDDSYVFYVVLDTVAAVSSVFITCTLAIETETVYPIDPKFLPKGSVGHEEIIVPGFEIKIYDSNPGDREAVYLPNQFAYYKVSDKVFTKEELIGAKLDYIDDEVIITESDIRDGSMLGVTTPFLGIVTINSMTSYAVSCKACTLTLGGGVEVTFPSDGTYFFGIYVGSYEDLYPGMLYVQELSKAEETKIITIDPKFLPGVCLPVVNLDDFMGNLEFDGNIHECPEALAKILETCLAEGLPCVFRVQMDEKQIVSHIFNIGAIINADKNLIGFGGNFDIGALSDNFYLMRIGFSKFLDKFDGKWVYIADEGN